MDSRYQRLLEDKKARKNAQLTVAKQLDGSERQIDARLHLDGRSQMEAPLNLSGAIFPPEGNQAAPTGAVLAGLDDRLPLDGRFPMTGQIVQTAGDPTLANHLSRKGYVDSKANSEANNALGSAKNYTDNQITDLKRNPPWASKDHGHGDHAHSYKYYRIAGATEVSGKTGTATVK